MQRPLSDYQTRGGCRDAETISERIRALRPPRRGVCADCRYAGGLVLPTRCDLYGVPIPAARAELCGPSGTAWEPRSGRPS